MAPHISLPWLEHTPPHFFAHRSVSQACSEEAPVRPSPRTTSFMFLTIDMTALETSWHWIIVRLAISKHVSICLLEWARLASWPVFFSLGSGSTLRGMARLLGLYCEASFVQTKVTGVVRRPKMYHTAPLPYGTCGHIQCSETGSMWSMYCLSISTVIGIFIYCTPDTFRMSGLSQKLIKSKSSRSIAFRNSDMWRHTQVQTGRLEETKDTQGTDKCSIKMQALLDTFTQGTKKIISPQLPSRDRFETS